MGEVELMELTQEYKRACAYMDDNTKSLDERSKHQPKFEKLVREINLAHLNTSEMKRFLF